MNIQRQTLWLVGVFALSSGLGACAPKTPVEKAKDKIEDAAHETKQGVKRAVDKVEDATK